MTTEAPSSDDRNLNRLVGGGHNYSYRFTTTSLANNNNNISVDENNSSNCSEDSHNTSTSSASSNNSASRKPSYVGLSCTVSGYSNFTRYQSPSRKTSPSAIPVSSPPQILDCNEYEIIRMRQPAERDSPPVRGQLDYDLTDTAAPGMRHYFPSSQTRKIITSDTGETTVETVTRFYGQRNVREESPCSDSSSSIGSLGSGNGNSGNLVQKQIERLYGGRVHAVRLTSPEPKSPESDELSPPEPGGFFAKRFGIVKQRDYSKKREPEETSSAVISNHPLELKTLKVPAVFRLLRPEFREQLKLNSCQVGIPLDQSSAPPKKERIIPIVREAADKNGERQKIERQNVESGGERRIPIVVERNGIDRTNADRDVSITSSPLKAFTRDTAQMSTPIRPTERDLHVATSSPLKAVTQRSPRSPVKPALPAKPLSPTRPSRVFSPKADSSENKSPPPVEDRVITVKVEKIEADLSIPERVVIEEITPAETPDENIHTTNGHNNSDAEPAACEPQEEEVVGVKVPEKLEDVAEEDHQHHDEYEEEEEVDPFATDRYVRSSTSPPCGLRERSLLCPIQEEDTESTASGCSVSVASRFAAVSSKEQTPMDLDSNESDLTPVAQERSNNTSVVIVDEFLILPKQEAAHDGHYFIKLLENEVFKFEEQICDFEEDLANDGSNIPEDIRDSILAAIGKAKLLISQKFVQFRGLCDKNISQNPEKDPFVPTSEDLAGFWDMVFLQVEHINSLFADLSQLRSNQWKHKVEEVKPNGVAPQPRARKITPTTKKGKNGLTNNNVTSAANTKLSEAAKARDEARKKMIEDKKRLMKERLQQQKEDQQDQTVEMFIPA